MASLNLLNTTPDYESIRSQLQADLATKGSWAGFLTTQTGQTIIDWIATVGALGQGKALRYGQDAYSETAVSDRAQYAIADMQGLRLTRKLAAEISVSMTYTQPFAGPGTVTLPAYTQFQGAGTYWYTNQAYVVAAGATVPITLHQGYIVDQTIAGLGTDYQVFVSVEDAFTVSDADVFVYVGLTQLTKGADGLWLYAGQQAFIDQTTPDGRLRLLFGNANYGYKPQVTDQIRIVYAVTSGYDGNSISTAAAKLSQVNNLISGLSYVVVSANPTGGADQPTAATYKTISSSNFGAFGSAVTRSQYIAAALEYPGVLDAKMFAQRELDPTNLQLMNTVKVVPITSSVWTTPQKNTFITYLQNKTMYAPRFYWVDPTAVNGTVTVNIYCYSWATLSECQASASAAVTALFALRRGILGYDIMLSDIYSTVLASNAGIEYLDIVSPTGDLLVSGKPMLAPTVTVLSTGGTLPMGTFSYAVYCTDSHGNTTPANFSTIVTVNTTSRASLSWAAYPGAVSYTVVGRGAPGFGNIATVSAPTTTYIDTGAVAPSGTLPTPANYPVLYNNLTSLTVNSDYSTRRI